VNTTKRLPKLLLTLPVVLFIVLGLLYFYGLTYDPNKSASRLINKAIPTLRLPSLFSSDMMLESSAIKGPAIINIWASWCGACRAEHDELKRIAEEENIKIYGIDYQDDAEIARTWLKKSGNPFEWIMFDGAAAAGLPLDIFSLPQTYAVDANGVIRARHIGALTTAVWNNMKTQLQRD
jgi:cytochrome c biogenesis protein CcmG/thiol:disulfide interchange protein DsbE